MKILITGSNGLLGQKLVKLLLEEGVEFLGTGKGSARGGIDYNYRTMDILNADEVHKVIHEFNPDSVIHTAAMTNVDECELNHEGCYDLNVNAVKYIVEATNAVNAHLVHLSTDFIFKGDDGPLTEDDVPDPVNYYGECKLEAEKWVIKYASNWSIARTVLVYGIVPDMSRSNIILWVKSNLEANKEIKVVDDQFRTPTLAEDLAMGTYLMAKSKANGVFNISGKDFLTPYEMAIYTAEYFNLDKSLITRTDSTIFKQPAKRPLKTGFVIDKAINEFGYTPHSFQEGIAIVDNQLQTINKV